MALESYWSGNFAIIPEALWQIPTAISPSTRVRSRYCRSCSTFQPDSDPDITYVRLASDNVYLAIVMDQFSRAIRGMYALYGLSDNEVAVVEGE